MGTIRRKDSKNRVLKNGEYERSNHRYEYRWTDSMKKRHSIYADTLPELREKEQYLIRDMYTGVQADSNTLRTLSVLAGIYRSSCTSTEILYRYEISTGTRQR